MQSRLAVRFAPNGLCREGQLGREPRSRLPPCRPDEQSLWSLPCFGVPLDALAPRASVALGPAADPCHWSVHCCDAKLAACISAPMRMDSSEQVERPGREEAHNFSSQETPRDPA